VIRIKAPKNKLAPPLCEMDIKMHRNGSIEPLTLINEEDEDAVK